MPERLVQCPQCHTTVHATGQPGETVKVTCPHCHTTGKVSFPGQTPNSGPPAIEVRNLTKTYETLTAVNNINFSVPRGIVFAFLGPNGAGKTTTVEMIESIRTPTNGTINILGYDITKDFANVKERIGILPQEFKSFERLNVRETLEYYSSFYKKRANIDAIIQAMDLQSVEKTLYKDLSGGLKQRVGVGIALVNDPDIVFLDEPSTGLDPKARREVWEVISSLRRSGKTVFLTTHYMEEAEYLADYISIIHKGDIIAEGTTDQLINRYGSNSTLRIKNCHDSEALRKLQEEGYTVQPTHNGDLKIEIDDQERVLEILSFLRHECIEYDSIDLRRGNLEEVFLHLTGSKLTETAS